MAAYLIVKVHVTDGDKFREYLKETPRVMNIYGGKYLARGGETLMLEGNDQPERVVLIEFPSLEKAKEWYNSQEYEQIKPLRQGAATASLIAVEGC